MFSELNNNSPQLWLTALLVVWAGLLFGGFFLGRLNADQTRRMPAWTRLFSSFILVIAAWSWYLFTRPTESGGYAVLIAIGMTLGLIGDLFMARLIPINNHILGGIGSFGLGHIFYISGFLSLASPTRSGFTIRWEALLIWWLIGILAWYFVVFRGQKPSILHYAALPYSLLLASTTGFATSLALQNSTFIPLAVGAALFLLSDLILAARLFNGLHFQLIDDVVWLTYGPAQMLIVYSVASLMSLLKT